MQLACRPRHNFVFLEGVRSALMADVAFTDGFYETPPSKGIRAMARVYARWGFSQAFYRQKLDLEMGYASLEEFLFGFWEATFLPRDANNLLAMLWTWQNGDISNNELFRGDFPKALASIKAKAIVMPASTDLYFRPEDNAIEVSHMPNAELRTIDTVWGLSLAAPEPALPTSRFWTQPCENCSPADMVFAKTTE